MIPFETGTMTFLVTAVVVTLRLRYRNGAELKQKQAAAQKLLTTDNQKIYKFVLTGGPCSGKTTALERLQVFLRERGYDDLPDTILTLSITFSLTQTLSIVGFVCLLHLKQLPCFLSTVHPSTILLDPNLPSHFNSL